MFSLVCSRHLTVVDLALLHYEASDSSEQATTVKSDPTVSVAVFRPND